MPPTATPQIRRIVSSFLHTGAVNTPSFRVALFKRAADRPVYPGLWAACSGSIEPTDASPLAAAWREIREETGLTAEKLTLSKAGKRLELTDEKLGKVWWIWCFVFRVKDDGAGREGKGGGKVEDLIVLDNEHQEVRFVSLEQMKELKTVEGLYENLVKTLEGGEEGA